MDINLVLGFFLLAFSLQVSVLGEDKGEAGHGFSFRKMFGGSKPSVEFLLYNRESNGNPVSFQAVVRRRSLLPGFKNNKPLKVVIHGWMGKDEKRFCSTMREGLLKNEDVNVITVDWSGDGSRNWLYPVSRSRVPEVAATVAEFLDNLNRQHGVKLEDIHVLGHSLGAHIAGIAGYKVTTGKIGRITGLDPAGPFFSMDKPDERLSKDSAIFVDVIHTCGKLLGFNDPIGHVDFYPNSGHFKQPGCGFDVSGACSHVRCYYFYLESVENKKAFPAVSCPSWNDYEKHKDKCDAGKVVYMGEGVSTSARGVYYLKTNKDSPYGLGTV